MSIPSSSNVCLVTGAGRGLGKTIANVLASSGFRLAISDVDPERADKTAKQIQQEGGVAIPLELNVSGLEDFKNALHLLEEEFGGVGVLVNNAALTKTTPIFEISPQEFDDVLTINLRGTFLGCQVFGKYFADQGYGRIINIASLAAQNGGAATGAHYAASKGGIVTLTKVFARDLAAKGVTVNAVSPGPLDVDLVREILPPEKLSAVTNSIPVGELGSPTFVGEVVKLLAAPSASSITGSTIDVNGGLYVR